MRAIIVVGLLSVGGCTSQETDLGIKKYIARDTFTDTLLNLTVDSNVLKIKFLKPVIDENWCVSFLIRNQSESSSLNFHLTDCKVENGVITIVDTSLEEINDEAFEIEAFFIWSNDTWRFTGSQIARFAFEWTENENLKYVHNSFHDFIVSLKYRNFLEANNYSPEAVREATKFRLEFFTPEKR